MNLFGCKFCDKDGDETDCDRKNFDTLLWALVTVFQVDAIILFYTTIPTHLHPPHPHPKTYATCGFFCGFCTLFGFVLSTLSTFYIIQNVFDISK